MLRINLSLTGLIALGLAALLILPACSSNRIDDHPELDRVIIETRGTAAPQTIAEWNRGAGWNVNALPTLTIGDASNNFGRASWTVRMWEGGEELEMTTVSNPGGDQPRVCSEESARYSVTQSNNVLYNPGETGLVTVAGEVRNTFHCDHIHVYPASAGTAQLDFVLWHADHADGRTQPISITVQNPPVAAVAAE